MKDIPWSFYCRSNARDLTNPIFQSESTFYEFVPIVIYKKQMPIKFPSSSFHYPLKSLHMSQQIICLFFLSRDRFPYFKAEDERWKNSVRHNLSMNPHFRKGNKAKHGSGHLWVLADIDEEDDITKVQNSVISNLFILLDGCT